MTSFPELEKAFFVCKRRPSVLAIIYNDIRVLKPNCAAAKLFLFGYLYKSVSISKPVADNDVFFFNIRERRRFYFMDKKFIPQITLFHCINAIADGADPTTAAGPDVDLKVVQLACSSMVKDVFLLRAFEAGSDGVLVLVCGQDRCRYTEGNIRANKRVAWVKQLLDEIGMDGRRLSLFSLAPGKDGALAEAFKEQLALLSQLGPNPAVG